jgi:hypothetical protein
MTDPVDIIANDLAKSLAAAAMRAPDRAIACMALVGALAMLVRDGAKPEADTGAFMQRMVADFVSGNRAALAPTSRGAQQ